MKIQKSNFNDTKFLSNYNDSIIKTCALQKYYPSIDPNYAQRKTLGWYRTRSASELGLRRERVAEITQIYLMIRLDGC